jgi:hypothetical protein
MRYGTPFASKGHTSYSTAKRKSMTKLGGASEDTLPFVSTSFPMQLYSFVRLKQAQ